MWAGHGLGWGEARMDVVIIRVGYYDRWWNDQVNDVDSADHLSYLVSGRCRLFHSIKHEGFVLVGICLLKSDILCLCKINLSLIDFNNTFLYQIELLKCAETLGRRLDGPSWDWISFYSVHNYHPRKYNLFMLRNSIKHMWQNMMTFKVRQTEYKSLNCTFSSSFW